MHYKIKFKKKKKAKHIIAQLLFWGTYGPTYLYQCRTGHCKKYHQLNLHVWKAWSQLQLQHVHAEEKADHHGCQAGSMPKQLKNGNVCVWGGKRTALQTSGPSLAGVPFWCMQGHRNEQKNINSSWEVPQHFPSQIFTLPLWPKFPITIQRWALISRNLHPSI